MSDRFSIYKVTDEYIDYLSQFDKNVMHQGPKYDYKTERDYLGVVLTVDGRNYYVPFSSYNDGRYNWLRKQQQVIVKVYDGSNSRDGSNSSNIKPKAFLRLAHMIPVPKSECELVRIKDFSSGKYRLIMNEMLYVNKEDNYNRIITKVSKMKTRWDNNSKYLRGRCLNFDVLEEAYDKWIYEHKK